MTLPNKEQRAQGVPALIIFLRRLAEPAYSSSMGHQPSRRLRRLSQIYSYRGHAMFFLTICTKDRKPLLPEPSAHERSIAFCEASPDKGKVWIGRYVLMPDHIHVFVSAQASQSVSRWVGSDAEEWPYAGEITPLAWD